MSELVSRQERQIVQPWLNLRDLLPGFWLQMLCRAGKARRGYLAEVVRAWNAQGAELPRLLLRDEHPSHRTRRLPSSMHANAVTPAETCRCVRRSLPGRPSAFPCIREGRFPHYAFRGLLGVHSRSGLHGRRAARGGLPECFSPCRYLHEPPWPLPAGATVAGWDSHPPGKRAFPRRTVKLSLRCEEVKRSVQAGCIAGRMPGGFVHGAARPSSSRPGGRRCRSWWPPKWMFAQPNRS